jgi:hypothetical protein
LREISWNGLLRHVLLYIYNTPKHRVKLFLIRSRYPEKLEQNDRPLGGEAEGEERRDSFIVNQKNEGFPRCRLLPFRDTGEQIDQGLIRLESLSGVKRGRVLRKNCG